MKIGFDARSWQRPPHSFRRVLDLLAHAAETAGWQAEYWVDGPIQPDCIVPNRTIRHIREPAEASDVFWSPHMECLLPSGARVATIHDINPLLPDGRPWLSRTYRGLRFRRNVKKLAEDVSGLVTVSEHSRQQILSAFPRLPKPPMVVPWYAEAAYQPIADAAVEAVLRHYDLDPGYFLFVGNFRRHKNWDGLIRAYGELAPELRRQHKLVLIGASNRGEAGLKKVIEEAGVTGSVVTPGQVTDAELPAIYNGALALAFPSFFEGFGLPPLEAMACGCPVIASDRASLPEVLGEAALFIAPDNLRSLSDAMQRVAKDANLRSSLQAAGLDRAQLFNPTRTASAMADVVDQLT